MTPPYRFGDLARREQIRTLAVDDFSDTESCSCCGFSAYGDIPIYCPQCGHRILSNVSLAQGTVAVSIVDEEEIRQWWIDQVALGATMAGRDKE